MWRVSRLYKLGPTFIIITTVIIIVALPLLSPSFIMAITQVPSGYHAYIEVHNSVGFLLYKVSYT